LRFGVVFSVDKLDLLSTDKLQPDTPVKGDQRGGIVTFCVQNCAGV